MSFKPILLNGHLLNVVVFGAGPIGIRKALKYADAGACVTLIDRDENKIREANKHLIFHTFQMDFFDYLSDQSSHFMAQHLVVMCSGDSSLNARLSEYVVPYGKLVNRTDQGTMGHFSDMQYESAPDFTLAASGNAKSPYVGDFLLKTALKFLNDETIMRRLSVLAKASVALKKRRIKSVEVSTYTIDQLERIANDEKI